MFNIGGTELFIILIIALIFVGPKRLPELARSIGKGIRELKKGAYDFQSEIENDVSSETNNKEFKG